MLNIGSIVTHPLFVGPGTIVQIHKDNGLDIFEVFWQSMNRNGFHSNKSLRLMTSAERQNF